MAQLRSPTGGWHSPGLSQEYKAIPGETYMVSFWVKNDGSEFVVRIGGVSALMAAAHKGNLEILNTLSEAGAKMLREIRLVHLH